MGFWTKTRISKAPAWAIRRRRRKGQALVEYALVAAMLCAYLGLVIWGVPIPGQAPIPGLYSIVLKVFARMNHVLMYPMGGDSGS